MKKVAIVFVVAVFVPSLVLAWLAFRSLHDQELVLERQQSLYCQGLADSLAKEADGRLADQQHEFGQQVESMLASRPVEDIAGTFNERLRASWPLAQIGFVVSSGGDILSPSPYASPETRMFCLENNKFLGSCESAEVYFNPKLAVSNKGAAVENLNAQNLAQSSLQSKGNQIRSVTPQQQAQSAYSKEIQTDPQQYSKISASEAEFRQLIGDSSEGALARFVENKLKVLLWYRSPREPRLIFGAQLSLPLLAASLQEVLKTSEPAPRENICIAILDDKAHPVALSRPGFQAAWKRPFVSTEIGEALPHWEAAVYLLDPGAIGRSAETLKFALGFFIGVLVLAISIGGWLIVMDLNRQLVLARQKTDFVSNVSHELKTPLTSIRMFTELLSEGRVNDPDKQRSYLAIITSETARLSRLINNVLDFARIDRGEKSYRLEDCDLAGVVRDTVAILRPHLESQGFKVCCEIPDETVRVKGDRDALAQIIVNLVSNAEKYSDGAKEMSVGLQQNRETNGWVEVRVLDRGPGVPRGCEDKIFEQFYRAHDSLSSGIQGSGLGLTLARQIARGHGGDVVYQPREGGGSCFILRLPLASNGQK
jgi:signal transduction histidine kinase